MADEITYVTLTAPERANLIRDRLKQLETEHQRLSIAVDTPVTGQSNPSDSTRLAEIGAQIQKLQARLREAESG
jgi:hypothetical protein